MESVKKKYLVLQKINGDYFGKQNAFLFDRGDVIQGEEKMGVYQGKTVLGVSAVPTVKGISFPIGGNIQVHVPISMLQTVAEGVDMNTKFTNEQIEKKVVKNYIKNLPKEVQLRFRKEHIKLGVKTPFEQWKYSIQALAVAKKIETNYNAELQGIKTAPKANDIKSEVKSTPTGTTTKTNGNKTIVYVLVGAALIITGYFMLTKKKNN